MLIQGEDGQEAMRADCAAMRDALREIDRKLKVCMMHCSAITSKYDRTLRKAEFPHDVAAILAEPAVAELLKESK